MEGSSMVIFLLIFNAVLAVCGAAITLIITKLFRRMEQAHAKIDGEIKDRYDHHIELMKEIALHMPEAKVKDFVDRTLRPMETKVDAISGEVKAVHNSVTMLIGLINKNGDVINTLNNKSG